MRADESMERYLESLLDGVYKALNEEGDEQLLQKIRNFFKPGHIALMKECCDGKTAEPYAAICHGDCWNNNVLFRNDEVPTQLLVSYNAYAYTNIHIYLSTFSRMKNQWTCAS